MQTGHINVMSAKARKLIEIEEEEALLGTIRFKRTRIELDETGGRFIRKPNFAIPVPSSERPVSADGRVAFHLKHSFVVKRARYDGSTALNSATLVISGDNESYSSDAADHDRYISREAAVMAIDAAAYDEYIESGGHEGQGAALFTNIHPDIERRAEFWDAVVRSERNPSPDVVTLHLERLAADQWQALLDQYDPGTPIGKLAQRYSREATDEAVAPASIECQLEFREFVKLRVQLRQMEVWDKQNPPITIKRGRGGRVQRRIVAEFPVGLDAGARIRIAGKYVEWLGGLGVMYTGVIHAPDHHNDYRNYHLHIAAYDRPCRYLEEHGCWDFEYREAVPGQHKRTRPSKRKNKMAGLTRPSNGRGFRNHGAELLIQIREKFADLCNEELKALGINRLFDHRSYVAMGIQQKPGRHLGTKAASLEAAGIPTMLGVENAERSWQGAFDRARNDHHVRQRLRSDCRGHAREALDRLLAARLASPVVGELNDLLIEFDRLQTTVGDQELDLALLYLTLQMAYSRADKTAEVCQRLVEAIENGGASAAERDSEDEIRERLRQAEEHQDRISKATQADVTRAGGLAEEVASQVERLDRTMKAMRKAIDVADHLLVPEDTLQPAVQVHRSELPNAEVRSRYSREVAAYYASPLDYEDEWDRVFMRIQYEDLEIKAPTERTPLFHVPGIAKEDLDRLMNPIFEKRSQARLRSMHKFQQLNRSRNANRAAARAATEVEAHQSWPVVSSIKSESRRPPPAERTQPAITAPPSEVSAGAVQANQQPRVEHFERLEREATDRRVSDRANAIDEWIAWFRAQYEGKAFPAGVQNGKLVLQLKDLPEDRRQIAEVFSEEVIEFISQEVAGEREVLRSLLHGGSRVLVRIEGHRAIYKASDFPPELRPNLELILGDPVVRGFIEQAPSEIARRHRALATSSPPPFAAPPTPVLHQSSVLDSVCVVEQASHLRRNGKSR